MQQLFANLARSSAEKDLFHSDIHSMVVDLKAQNNIAATSGNASLFP